MQQFEQVLADLLRLRGILRLVVQVPVAHGVLYVTSPARRHHADRSAGGGLTAIGEQRGVLQQRLAAHHATRPCLRHALPRLLPVTHTTVRNDLVIRRRRDSYGDFHVRADRADRVPVTHAAILPLLLFSATVYREKESTLLLQHFTGAKRVLKGGEEANLHRERNPIAVELMHDRSDTIKIGK